MTKAGRVSIKLILLHGLLCIIFADGLPGEYLVSSRWRDLMWRHSPLTNPAFPIEEEFVMLRGAFSSTMQGAFKLWEFGVTLPIGSRQSVGATVLGENDGEIESATFDETSGRLVAGGSTSSNHNTFIMLSYAINPWKRLSLGANANLAHQSNFDDPLWGMGLDIGCSYRFLEHSEFGNHTVGLSTVNLLAPSMSSSFAPQIGNEGAYSRDLRISWFATLWDNQLESGLEMDIKDFWANADEFQDLGSASRAAKELEWGIAWRLGALIKRFFNVYLQLGFDEHVIEYWGLAGGVKIPLAHQAKNISTLYQYNLKTEGTLASAHTVYLFVNFEKPFQDRREKAGRDSVAEDRSEQREESLNDLKKIIGLEITEGDEYVQITAEEVALHFKSGSSELPRKCVQVIKKIASFLRAYPDNPVSIEGHTDSDPITGTLKRKYADNQTLSKARAEKVKEYFVFQEKLPEKLFTTRGYGDSKPIASNDTKEGKYKNRRVVITIQKK